MKRTSDSIPRRRRASLITFAPVDFFVVFVFLGGTFILSIIRATSVILFDVLYRLVPRPIDRLGRLASSR
jgi:hypothetical protein